MCVTDGVLCTVLLSNVKGRINFEDVTTRRVEVLENQDIY